MPEANESHEGSNEPTPRHAAPGAPGHARGLRWRGRTRSTYGDRRRVHRWLTNQRRRHGAVDGDALAVPDVGPDSDYLADAVAITHGFPHAHGLTDTDADPVGDGISHPDIDGISDSDVDDQPHSHTDGLPFSDSHNDADPHRDHDVMA